MEAQREAAIAVVDQPLRRGHGDVRSLEGADVAEIGEGIAAPARLQAAVCGGRAVRLAVRDDLDRIGRQTPATLALAPETDRSHTAVDRLAQGTDVPPPKPKAPRSPATPEKRR